MRYLFVCISLLCSLWSTTLYAQQQQSVLPLDSIIRQDAKKDVGFYTVYEQEGRYYLLIPEDKLERDILATITILKGSAQVNRDPGMRFGYGGDSVFERLMRFRKNGNNIEIVVPRVYYLREKASDYDAYLKSSLEGVDVALPILAEEDGAYLVDITELWMKDMDFFLLKGAKGIMKLGNFLPQQSYPLKAQAFPENLNFISRCTYSSANKVQEGDFAVTTWEVAASWFLLPEKPMDVRLFDERVGFFTTTVDGMLEREDKVEKVLVANRWRLEPKPEDMEKFYRGELVEPKKPIVFYIDRATPEYLVPYFIQAVNAWQPVFEKAGFKNAIYAKLAPTPEEDPEYNEGDVRYPLVSYKASPIPNAYGPMVVDPRSGEVITAHIAIFHSVQSLLQRWYFVMCSVVDPRAREYPINKEVMGELAATVLTHEVGHSLGLRHHFMGSTIYPVDSLRSKRFVEKHGLGASIMDYQRFNYIAQAGDGMELRDLLPKVGVYDDFAIEWGYRVYPGRESLDAETKLLRAWVTEKREDYKYRYMEERTLQDPRIQSEDSGDDVIYANRLGMENLKVIMDHLEEWTPASENYATLRERYMSVLSQYYNYVNHVLKYVGGIYSNNPDRNEDIVALEFVEKEKQEAAFDFLKEYVFSDQDWLYREELMQKTGVDFNRHIQDPISAVIAKTLMKYNALAKGEEMDENGLSVQEYMDKLYAAFFETGALDKPLSRYEKMLQSVLLQNLVISVENQANLYCGKNLLVNTAVVKIKNRLEKALKQSQLDALTAAHYKTLYDFIILWETGKNSALLN